MQTSLVNWDFLFHNLSYAGRESSSHMHIGISWIVQLCSYHWHILITVKYLKLNLMEHSMTYLQIWKPNLQLLQWSDVVLNRIHAKWQFSLEEVIGRRLLEDTYQAEICGLGYQIPFPSPLELRQCTVHWWILSMRKGKNRSVDWILLKPDWYL